MFDDEEEVTSALRNDDLMVALLMSLGDRLPRDMKEEIVRRVF